MCVMHSVERYFICTAQFRQLLCVCCTVWGGTVCVPHSVDRFFVCLLYSAERYTVCTT